MWPYYMCSCSMAKSKMHKLFEEDAWVPLTNCLSLLPFFPTASFAFSFCPAGISIILFFFVVQHRCRYWTKIILCFVEFWSIWRRWCIFVPQSTNRTLHYKVQLFGMEIIMVVCIDIEVICLIFFVCLRYWCAYIVVENSGAISV